MATRLSQVPATELDIVDRMLRAIKENPVADLIEPTTPDVDIALGIFSDFNRQFQSNGWHFNIDYDVTLARDASNEIQLGTNILSVLSPTRDLTMRGARLYDRADKTFTFTQDVTDARTITLLDFEDIPPLARTYVGVACARIMQEEVFTDSTAERINIAEETRAWGSFQDDESERAGHNMGTGNIEMFETIHRYKGRNNSIWLR